MRRDRPRVERRSIVSAIEFRERMRGGGDPSVPVPRERRFRQCRRGPAPLNGRTARLELRAGTARSRNPLDGQQRPAPRAVTVANIPRRSSAKEPHAGAKAASDAFEPRRSGRSGRRRSRGTPARAEPSMAMSMRCRGPARDHERANRSGSGEVGMKRISIGTGDRTNNASRL